MLLCEFRCIVEKHIGKIKVTIEKITPARYTFK